MIESEFKPVVTSGLEEFVLRDLHIFSPTAEDWICPSRALCLRIFARKLKTYLSSTMGCGDWNFDGWLSFVGDE